MSRSPEEMEEGLFLVQSKWNPNIYVVHGVFYPKVNPEMVAWFAERGRVLQVSPNARFNQRRFDYVYLDEPVMERAAAETRMRWNARIVQETGIPLDKIAKRR